MDQVQQCVVYTVLAAGVISFLIYVLCFLYYFLYSRPSSNQSLSEIKEKYEKGLGSIDDISKILDLWAKASDSFSKSGPAVSSLIGSILLFSIAAISVGLLNVSATIQQPANKSASVPHKKQVNSGH